MGKVSNMVIGSTEVIVEASFKDEELAFMSIAQSMLTEGHSYVVPRQRCHAVNTAFGISNRYFCLEYDQLDGAGELVSIRTLTRSRLKATHLGVVEPGVQPSIPSVLKEGKIRAESGYYVPCVSGTLPESPSGKTAVTSGFIFNAVKRVRAWSPKFLKDGNFKEEGGVLDLAQLSFMEGNVIGLDKSYSKKELKDYFGQDNTTWFEVGI